MILKNLLLLFVSEVFTEGATTSILDSGYYTDVGIVTELYTVTSHSLKSMRFGNEPLNIHKAHDENMRKLHPFEASSRTGK